jgi:hypothetical protein
LFDTHGSHSSLSETQIERAQIFLCSSADEGSCGLP